MSCSVTYTAGEGYSLTGDEVGAWGARTTEETVGVDETTQLQTNGTFTTNTDGWTASNATLAVVSGELEITSTSDPGRAYQDITVVAGQMYAVTVPMRMGTVGTAAQVELWNGANFTTGLALASNTTTSNETVTIYGKATGTTLRVSLRATGTTGTAYFDNLTVTKTGQLITNGGFGADYSWTKGTGWTISGGVATHAAGSLSTLYQSVAFVDGESYVVTFTVSGRTAGTIYPRLAGTTNVEGTARSANGTYTETLVANSSSVTFSNVASSDFDGSIDNISVRLADPDISAEGDGLEHHGQLTYAAVNTGSDLVAASGFTAYNYLRQPYNANFDFGSGKLFTVRCRLYEAANSAIEQIFMRAYYTAGAYSGAAISLYVTAAGLIEGKITDDAFATADTVTSTTAIDDAAEFYDVVLTCDGTTLYLYINAVLEDTTTISAAAGSLTNTNATVRWGLDHAGAYPLTQGKWALPRVLDVHQTAAQIKTRYNKEIVLFNEYAYYTQEGEEYTLDLAPQVYGPSKNHVRNKSISMGGVQEVIRLRKDSFWDVTTGYYFDTELDPVRRFIDSVADGQTFTLAPPAPFTDTNQVTLESDSYTENRIDSSRYFDVSFRCKKVP